MRITVLLLLLSCTLALLAQTPARDGSYLLSDFGDVSKMPAAKETLDKAAAWIVAHGGGMLIVPPGTTPALPVRNNYQTERPNEIVPTVTIIDRRMGNLIINPPQVGEPQPFQFSGWSGMRIDRTLDNPAYLPPWGMYQAVAVNNTLLRGSSSVLRTVEVVKNGDEVRLYPETFRGIFPNQRLSFTMAGLNKTITVKGLFWDAQRQQQYFTADLPEVKANGSGQLSNKNFMGTMLLTTAHNADDQTFDFHVWREQYAHGDGFAISGWYGYQGDVMSARGDENGVVLNAEIEGDVDPFSGKVESVDWNTNALKFAPGARNANKLATSRALINLNEKKWLTAGTVKIVGADDWSGMLLQNPVLKDRGPEFTRDGIDIATFPFTYTENGVTRTSLTTWDGKPVRRLEHIYRGRAYPSLIYNGVNWLGGKIIGSAECGWTPAVVGRFFTVAEDGEYVSPSDGGGYFTSNPPGKTYRWYLIRSFSKNADGTCVIRVERVRYASVPAGAPTLYDNDHYTRDGAERPLRYIIAPGAWVTDISEGWKEGYGSAPGADHPRTLRLAPGPDKGTAFDFAAGDPITEAIGAEPVFPKGVRIRQFNKVPSSWPNAAIDITNGGLVSTYAGLLIGVDGATEREALLKGRKDHQPGHRNGIAIEGVTGAGIRFGADVVEGALVFEQPHHAQPLVWQHALGKTVLMVNPQSGSLSVTGGPVSLPAVKGVQGLSATPVAANNLRGIDVPVPEGAKLLKITFSTHEADARYSVTLQPTWFTLDRTVTKTPAGFIVEFATPAPKGATVDWQLIR